MKIGFGILLISILSLGSIALGGALDSERQNEVIERLEGVLSKIDSNEPARVSSTLRLADLLAERARLRFMREIESKCQGCHGSIADRKRAIALYENLIGKTEKATEGLIFFQLAHLYEMAGKTPHAVSLFNRVIARPQVYGSALVARTHEGLGDLFFHKGQYQKSLHHYQQSLNYPESRSKGLIYYRIAWCRFSLGQLKSATAALEDLMQKRNLLTKETADGPVYDAAFHSDIARDLATFYSRATVSNTQIGRYSQLIPGNQRKELLLIFAEEVDRVGQKSAARQVYQLYLQEPNITKDERTDALVRLTLVKYDIGHQNQSVQEFAAAAASFKSTGCESEANCAEIQKRLRRYVTELHRANKTQLNDNILRAYEIYVETFPNDAEMSILGAQVAVDLKKYQSSVNLYRNAAIHSKQDAKFLQTALLGEIEAAELSKNLQLRESAYKYYLSAEPNGKRQFEIRYQLAQVSYERKAWSAAADQFRALAHDSAGPADLRKKSADLALDCLAIEKRDGDIESWSLAFANVFPKNSSEFMRTARKANNNQVVRITNDKSASASTLNQALAKLKAAPLAGATDQERILHYQNLSLIAEKAEDFATLMFALDELLKIRSLSAQDREIALSRKVGYYETHLDFARAYALAKKMKLSKLSRADRELRLGGLADMAGLNPRPHYHQYLALSGSSPKTRATRLRLITLARNPLAEFRLHEKNLRADTSMSGDALLFAFAKTKDSRSVQAILQRSGLARSGGGRMISKHFFFSEHERLNETIARSTLQSSNQLALQRSIEKRMQLLSRADQSLKSALSLNDFTSSVAALSTIVRENNRFVQELLALPAPRGLNERELAKYQMLVNQRAQPYIGKANTAQLKLNEFWNNPRALQGLFRDLANSRFEIRYLFVREARILANLAPTRELQSQISSAVSDSETSVNELAQARKDVSQDPKNPALVQKLISLETKMGNPVIASYLEKRLERIRTRGVL